MNNNKETTTVGGLYFLIWRNVASFCTQSELYNLAFTNTILHEVCDHAPLWNNLLKFKNFVGKDDAALLLNEENKDVIINFDLLYNFRWYRRARTRKIDPIDESILLFLSSNNNPALHLVVNDFMNYYFPLTREKDEYDGKEIEYYNPKMFREEDRFVDPFFGETARKFFPKCRQQCQLLMLIDAAETLPEHSYCALYNNFRHFQPERFYKVINPPSIPSEQNVFRRIFDKIWFGAVSLMFLRNFCISKTEIRSLVGIRFGHGDFNRKEAIKKEAKIAQTLLDDSSNVNLPLKIAISKLRHSCLEFVELGATANEIFSGFVTDYFFLSYTRIISLLFFWFVAIFVVVSIGVKELFIRLDPEFKILSRVQGGMIGQSCDGCLGFVLYLINPVWCVAARLEEAWSFQTELLLFLIPHIFLALQGGGYFGVFYSMKRIESTTFKIIFLLANNVGRTLICCGILPVAASTLLLLLLFALWITRFYVIASILVLFASSLYFVSSRTGKVTLAKMLHGPIKFFMWSFLHADEQQTLTKRNDVTDNVVRMISSFFVSIFSNKFLRMAIAASVALILGIYYIFPWSVSEIVKNIGNIFFAVPYFTYDPPNNNLYDFFNAENMSLYSIIKFLSGMIWCIVLYFIQDGRNSTLEAKSRASSLKRQVWTVLCVFMTVRFENVCRCASSSDALLNFGFWNLFVAKMVICGFGSDFYRLYYLSNKKYFGKDSYDHEFFKLDAFSNTNKKEGGEEESSLISEELLHF